MSGYGMAMAWPWHGMAWQGTILQFIKFTEPQMQQIKEGRLFALIDVLFGYRIARHTSMRVSNPTDSRFIKLNPREMQIYH